MGGWCFGYLPLLWGWLDHMCFSFLQCRKTLEVLLKLIKSCGMMEGRWVGGVSDGDRGAAAMNLSSGTLHVHNTWGFGDTAFVHLGAGLDCSTGSAVVTSLANRLLGDGEVWVGLGDSVQRMHAGVGKHAMKRLDAGNHTFAAGSVRWVWHGCSGSACAGSGTAYVILQTDAAVKVANTKRAGDWSNLGTASGAITRATLQVLLDHGLYA